MSTRSLIARQTETGYEAIYCHHDGNPAHHGPILTQHYAYNGKVEALMDLGSLSVLGPELGEAHAFNTHDARTGFCLAYGRDRQEPNCERQIALSEDGLTDLANACGADYLYLFCDGRWFYRKAPFAGAWVDALA